VDDVDEPQARGVVIRTWGGSDPCGPERARVLVVDVTDNPSEPCVRDVADTTLQQIDGVLHQLMDRQLQYHDGELIEWVGSEFNEINGNRCLVSACIASERGIQTEYVMLRLSIGDRKFRVEGCYVSEHSAAFEESVFTALQSVRAGTQQAG
jgi:hypothetical protein